MSDTRSDEGFFHLTPTGWVRKDHGLVPEERVETWLYRMERPSPSAKARVRLTRIWTSQDIDEHSRDALRARFGDAVTPNADQNVLLTCDV